MLVNGLIYRHGWFTMCTGKFSTASLIYHLKCTPGCWYAKNCIILWLLLLLNRTLRHNHSSRFGFKLCTEGFSVKIPQNKDFYSGDLEYKKTLKTNPLWTWNLNVFIFYSNMVLQKAEKYHSILSLRTTKSVFIS